MQNDMLLEWCTISMEHFWRASLTMKRSLAIPVYYCTRCTRSSSRATRAIRPSEQYKKFRYVWKNGGISGGMELLKKITIWI